MNHNTGTRIMNVDVSCAKCNKPGDATVTQVLVPKFSNINPLEVTREPVYTLAPPDGWIAFSVYRTGSVTMRFVCTDCRRNAGL